MRPGSSSPPGRVAIAGHLILLCSLLFPRPAAPQQPPPDAAWRQFDTEHFTVTYPERMASLARTRAPPPNAPSASSRSASSTPPAAASSSC